jgi:hypothetical protein
MKDVKCTRCGVTVPFEKLDVANRCLDWRCPTMSYGFRLTRARMLGMQADWLAMKDARSVEVLAGKTHLEAAE